MGVSRDEQIIALRAAGVTLAEIGRRFRISRQRVAQIIDRSEQGRVPRREVVTARQSADSRRARRQAEEILVLWREGAPVGEIQARAGVSQRAVRDTVAALASDADRRARSDVRRARLAERHRTRYDDAELLDGLRLVATRVGHAPSCREYSRLSEGLGLARMPTVYSRFGGWRLALRAAGFDVPADHVRAPRWSIASCWRALVSVADQLGDPPSYRRYEHLAAAREDLPSGSTLRLRLGLWPQIVAALREHAQTDVTSTGEAA